MFLRVTTIAAIFGLITACGEDAPRSYTVGGNVSGVAGSGVTLQVNGGDPVTLTRDGSFVFSQPLASGTAFTVTVSRQPTGPSQDCVVSNQSGSVSRSNVNTVLVTCATKAFTVGGTVTGLVGFGLALEDTENASRAVALYSNGAFTLPTRVNSGAHYSATVVSQPTNPSQTCVASNVSGTVGSAPVTNIVVTCTTNRYFVRGNVSGLTGSGLVLRVNGGSDLPIGSTGSFSFPAPLTSGSPYSVTVEAQPGTRRELCTVGNAAGTIGGEDVTVTVSCTVLLGFVYTSQTGGIAAYGIDSQSGALLTLGTAVHTATSPEGMVANPAGTFLYASLYASNDIATFKIDSDHGTLTAAGAPVSSGSSFRYRTSLAITPSGRNLYVANWGSGELATFSIDPATGVPLPAGTPLRFDTRLFLRMSISSDGKHLYSLILDSQQVLPPVLALYNIDGSTGALTAGAAVTLPPEAADFALDPLGRFIYMIMDHTNPFQASVVVTAYGLDATTGELATSGTDTTVNSNGAGLAPDPTGRYAYLVNTFGYTPADIYITALAVNQASGKVTEIGVTVPNSRPTGAIVCDPSGRFVLVANAGALDPAGAPWNEVSSYAISTTAPTTGQLTLAGTGIELPADARTLENLAIVE